MPKNAVYDPSAIFDISQDIKLKQMALTFDTIYLSESILKDNIQTDEAFRKIGVLQENRITQRDDMLEHLIGKKVIALYNGPNYTERGPAAFADIFNYIEGDQISPVLKRGLRIGATDILLDIMVRDDAARLSVDRREEFYPILKSARSYQEEGRKTEVIQLIYKQIPIPSADTSWEAIIDYRNDENVRLKYLALMDWVNGIATTSLSINEINEKIEYLFLDYKRAFERHKLKANFSILEILVSVGIGILTADYRGSLNLVSNLIKVGVTTLNLNQEEGQLPGKEIAYIYHTNLTFDE